MVIVEPGNRIGGALQPVGLGKPILATRRLLAELPANSINAFGDTTIILSIGGGSLAKEYRTTADSDWCE
ncbi:MAG: hypothetical protein R3C56_42285 [Pirellulaceae bacterium]